MNYFKNRINKNLNAIDPYVPGRPIEEIKRLFKVKRIYKMASNENPLGTSPRALEAIRKDLPSVNRYPDDNCFYLRARLAKKYALEPAQFVFTRGSYEMIELAAAAFLDEKSEVIVAKPTFLMYAIAARLKGARVAEIPTKTFCYDLEKMTARFTKNTKMVFIGNPDNPCGTYSAKKELETLLAVAEKKKILVFLDEAYYEVAERNKDYLDGIAYLKKGYRNLIVARTFSKAYGLAGLRIGYGATTQELAGYLNKARPPFNVDRLAQAAAAAALDDARFLSATRALLAREKKYFAGALRALNIAYVPSYTNFILIRLGSRARGIAKALLKQGIIVRAMSDWGLYDYIRVTIGAPQENRAFMRALQKLL